LPQVSTKGLGAAAGTGETASPTMALLCGLGPAVYWSPGGVR
jgi:hypothetical protein